MPTTTSLTPTDLATFTAYAGLPADTVAWLLAHGPGRTYAAGETIFEPGTPAEPMAAVLRGGIQFCAQQGSQREPVFRVEARQVAGGLPYSRLHEIKKPGVAADETVLCLMHHDLFTALEDSSPELVQRLVFIMNDRSRDLVADPRYPEIWKKDCEPYLLETCAPSIFAAGGSRAGAMAHVAVAVGSMAIKFVHQYLDE